MRVLSKTFIKCFPLGSPPKCKGGGLIYESNTNLYEMQSHPGRFLGQHASDADSNGQRRMEAGRTIMLPNAMMQMPIQMQLDRRKIFEKQLYKQNPLLVTNLL